MVKVSVILTSFNHGEYIAKSIESILNQSFNDFELIIIDDCSTDDSWEIINSFNDKRIIAIRNKENYYADGVIFNTITKYATGEYCAIAHSDDTWDINKLQKQYDFLSENPKYGACFTKVEFIDENDEVINNDNNFLYKNVFDKENRSKFEWLNHFFYNSNCLCHPSIMIKTKLYKECDLDVKGLFALPDFCQWIRLCLKEEIWILPEKLIYFRIRDNAQNTSGDTFEKSNLLFFETYKILNEFLKITDNSGFLKVFPNAKKFVINGEFIKEFAFSQILLDERNNNIYHFFGLNLLNDLFTNNEMSKKLKTLYNFTASDFVLAKSRYDVFSMVDKKRLLNCSLYLDCGEGFNEQLRLAKENVYIDKLNCFKIEFDIEKYSNIKKIRFDPDENTYRKYKIINTSIDDKKINIAPQNSISEDGWDFFYTLDPSYLIESFIGNKKKIIIEATTEEIILPDIRFLMSKNKQNSKKIYFRMFLHRLKELVKKCFAILLFK